MAAAFVDIWHGSCAGGRAGQYGRVASCGVDRCDLAEVRRPDTSIAEAFGLPLLHQSRVSCWSVG